MFVLFAVTLFGAAVGVDVEQQCRIRDPKTGSTALIPVGQDFDQSFDGTTGVVARCLVEAGVAIGKPEKCFLRKDGYMHFLNPGCFDRIGDKMFICKRSFLNTFVSQVKAVGPSVLKKVGFSKCVAVRAAVEQRCAVKDAKTGSVELVPVGQDYHQSFDGQLGVIANCTIVDGVATGKPQKCVLYKEGIAFYLTPGSFDYVGDKVFSCTEFAEDTFVSEVTAIDAALLTRQGMTEVGALWTTVKPFCTAFDTKAGLVKSVPVGRDFYQSFNGGVGVISKCTMVDGVAFVKPEKCVLYVDGFAFYLEPGCFDYVGDKVFSCRKISEDTFVSEMAETDTALLKMQGFRETTKQVISVYWDSHE